MDAESVMAIVLGVACVAGIGMAATTLQSTVETTPDEAIEIEESEVPLGDDEKREYYDRLRSGSEDTGGADGGSSEGEEGQTAGEQGDGPTHQNQPSTDAPPPESGGQTDPDAAPPESGDVPEDGEPPEGADPSDSDADQGGDSGQSAGGETGSGPGSDGDRAGTTPPDQRSWLEKLLGWLRALLAQLLALLPLLVGLVALATVVAGRGRIAAHLRGGRDSSATRDEVDPGPTVGSPEPTNEVSRAWYEMTRLVGIEGRATKTPRECAEEAKARGLSPGAVETLTRVFEEVQYGQAAVSEERRDRVSTAMDRLRRDGRGTGR